MKREHVGCASWKRRYGSICGRDAENGREWRNVARCGNMGVGGGREGKMVDEGSRGGEKERGEGQMVEIKERIDKGVGTTLRRGIVYDATGNESPMAACVRMCVSEGVKGTDLEWGCHPTVRK